MDRLVTPPQRLWLVRHARAAAAPEALVGWTDVPLADPAHAACELGAVAAAIQRAAVKIEAVYSSDLRRAADCAALLAGALAVPCLERPALRELHFGRWELSSWAALARDEPAAAHSYLAAWRRAATPGGESQTALARRVASFWAEASRAHRGAIAVVGHAGALRTLAELILGDDSPWSLPLAPAHVCILEPPAAACLLWNAPPLLLA